MITRKPVGHCQLLPRVFLWVSANAYGKTSRESIEPSVLLGSLLCFTQLPVAQSFHAQPGAYERVMPQTLTEQLPCARPCAEHWSTKKPAGRGVWPCFLPFWVRPAPCPEGASPLPRGVGRTANPVPCSFLPHHPTCTRPRPVS